MNIVLKQMDSAPLDGTRVLLECEGYHGGTFYTEGWFTKWSSLSPAPNWMPWTGSPRIKSTAKLKPIRWANIHET